MRSKHKRHLIVLTDAQIENKIDIHKIKNYVPIDHKKCNRQENMKKISGTVIYVREEYAIQYSKVHKNKDHEIVWFVFLAKRYWSIYNRPYSTSDNKKRVIDFYKNLDSEIEKYGNDKTTVMEDFNAHCPQ